MSKRAKRVCQPQPAAIRIGVSGWTYSPWRGHFYPKGLVQKNELAFAARQFPTLEINGTFYGLQKPGAFARWAQAAPDGFVFAIKGSRYITHMRRLRDIETPLANFLASGLLQLGSKLGPLLWQFPPNFRFDSALMEDFLALLPQDTQAAAALAGRHDERLAGRAWLRAGANQPVRHAIEIRHDSFRDPIFIDLLRHYGVALVCADTVEWPRLMDLTGDFVYCRLHGSAELYRSRYEKAELERWAARFQAWASGEPMRDGEFVGDADASPSQPRDVFVFFDNTDKRHAPGDAATLMRVLKLAWNPEGDKQAAAIEGVTRAEPMATYADSHSTTK
ncbi:MULTISPECIES: DUF72 domain-containing protein [unclassified Bosea (in: a-proteobacteria)]|uniref:DUF72 domain-containing protein n=1 Tax=unclassified Bosea (in: a-proteobacteria) TaxID=2653178 RepID=UPI000F7600CB|nr:MULTISPECIES: DUF72 domain-containing protein [unclassified Bosea (in: a-proteobacteria)]AZO82054.1 hypothetical protein BLM15_30150 [Bosea sp. Tri-49]RXT24627.1 hypothetical protein B5U98_08265 [Bosea sp. Tri-39]RXT42462.1 hypothetical protein B5U99_00735 [Bosea sp. Tri-54]